MGNYAKADTYAGPSSDETTGNYYYRPFNVLRNTWSLRVFTISVA